MTRPANTKGNLLSLLVTFGFALMLILALSWLVFKILALFGVITPDIQCDWSVLLIAITKLGTAGLADIPPQCKTDYITISASDLEKLSFDAETAIRQYRAQVNANNAAYLDVYQHFNDPDNAQQRHEWALNHLIAGHMKRCWTKVHEGKLPLFDSWWNLLDWDFFGATRPTTHDGALTQFRDPAFTIPGTDRSLLQVYGPPTFCVYCTRIKFDDDVRALIGKDSVDSLAAWMKATQARPGSDESVFEFLLDETLAQNQQATYVQSIRFPYTVTTPYAVEYARVNGFGADITGITSDASNYASIVLGDGADINTDRINRLVLIPAIESVYPFGTGTPSETSGPIQCLQQVG